MDTMSLTSNLASRNMKECYGMYVRLPHETITSMNLVLVLVGPRLEGQKGLPVIQEEIRTIASMSLNTISDKFS